MKSQQRLNGGRNISVVYDFNIIKQATRSGIAVYTIFKQGENMNFYLGNGLDQIDEINDYNLALDDELLDIINSAQIQSKAGFDLSAIQQINPYADEVIPVKEIPKLEEALTNLINSSILHGTEDSEYYIETVSNLIVMCEKAQMIGVGLISVGD